MSQMMACSMQTINLAIEHVREPRQRVPVAGIKSGKSPGNASPTQACLNTAILRYILLIVIIQKFMVPALPEHGQGDQPQGEANDPDFYLTLFSLSQSGLRGFSAVLFHKLLIFPNLQPHSMQKRRN